MTCRTCQRETPTAELTAYQGRCEDCFTKRYADQDAVGQREWVDDTVRRLSKYKLMPYCDRPRTQDGCGD